MFRPLSARFAKLFKTAKKPVRPTSKAPRLAFEALEDRVVPAQYNFNATANTLIISLDSGESLAVTEVAAVTTFTISTGTFTAIGPDTAVGNGTNAIVIQDADLASALT